MRKMRTIGALAKHYRAQDEHTAVTAHFLRQKVLSGEIPHVRAGCKRLIAIEAVDAFWAGEVAPPEPVNPYGKIRAIM